MTASDKSLSRPEFNDKPLDERKRQWLVAFVEGGWRGACAAVGCASSLPTYWRKTDPAFARAADEAKTYTAERLEAQVDDAIEGRVEMSQVQASLVKWRLAALKPGEYRDRVSVEQTGADGGPIKIEGDAQRGMDLLNRWRDDRALN